MTELSVTPVQTDNTASRLTLWLKRAALLCVGAFLVWRLTEIGWQDVGRALPTSPLFYLLFVVMYLALPLSEVLIYEKLWQQPMFRHSRVFLMKRILNFGVLAYSGEAYFAMWAKNTLGRPAKSVLSDVKDVNILSGLTSNTLTVVMLGGVLLFADPQIVKDAGLSVSWPIILFFAGSAVLVGVVVKFRQRILSIGLSMAAWISSAHTVRLIGIMALQAVQWAVALPMVGFDIWLFFLTVQLVVTRIPFLPNKELVFMGAGLSMTGVFNVPEPAVAAMFLTSGALSQVANAALFVWAGRPSGVDAHDRAATI